MDLSRIDTKVEIDCNYGGNYVYRYLCDKIFEIDRVYIIYYLGR